MSESRQFSLINVIVIVAIVIVLLFIIAPFINRMTTRGPAAQQNDKANLRGIYQGIMGYAGENNDKYPAYARTRANAQSFNKTLRQEKLLPDSPAFEAATDSNISAAMWLMVREDHLPVKIFVSPNVNKDSADTVNNANGEKVTVTDLYDFEKPENFSYSSINFYHEDIRSKWSNSVGPTYVLMGNQNDGIHAGSQPTDYDQLDNNKNMNSLTHQGKGQNMVFGDGHAEFVSTPVGPFNKQDNAYTWWDVAGDPDDKYALQHLIAGNAQWLTSNKSGMTVKRENIKYDVFLLPRKALAEMASKP